MYFIDGILYIILDCPLVNESKLPMRIFYWMSLKLHVYGNNKTYLLMYVMFFFTKSIISYIDEVLFIVKSYVELGILYLLLIVK